MQVHECLPLPSMHVLYISSNSHKNALKAFTNGMGWFFFHTHTQSHERYWNQKQIQPLSKLLLWGETTKQGSSTNPHIQGIRTISPFRPQQTSVTQLQSTVLYCMWRRLLAKSTSKCHLDLYEHVPLTVKLGVNRIDLCSSMGLLLFTQIVAKDW